MTRCRRPYTSLAGGGRDELAVLDALGADQPVGDVLDLARLAAQHDDLEAVVGVEVDVQGRDDLLVVRVLVLGELVGQVAARGGRRPA